MTKLIALVTPLIATLILSSPPQTEAAPAPPAGPAPAARAWFRVERGGFHHLVVHANRACPGARLDVEFRSVVSRGRDFEPPLTEGRLEGVRLLDDGQTVAATLRLPAGETVLAVSPAGEACPGLEIESVELKRR